MRWIRIVPSLSADCVTFINDFLRKAGPERIEPKVTIPSLTVCKAFVSVVPEQTEALMINVRNRRE